MQKLLFVIALALVSGPHFINAQEEKEVKKVIIIKKTDEDGKVIEEKFESEDGEFSPETRKKLREMRMDMKESRTGDEITIEIQKEGEGNPDKKGGPMWKNNPKKGRAAWIARHPKVEKEIIIERNDAMEKPQNKAVLGIGIDDTDYGVKVTEVMTGSAAEAAGLRRGDVLLKVNNGYIFSSNGLLESLHPYNPGDKVKIKYLREGKEKSATVTLKASK